MPIEPPLPVTIGDIRDAAERLRGRAVRTPILRSTAIDAAIGGRVLVKAEALQKTGSFKYRGAFNRLSRLAPAEAVRGVVAYSSGNHGQAVAAVASELGIAATIVMPADAPAVKVAGVRRFGATVVPYDRAREDRVEVATRLAENSGGTIIPPFDDPHVIAGQGTVGLEIGDQLAERNIEPDIVLVPCSGGGLIAGCAVALLDRWPDARIFAVEPEGFDDTGRSLASGKRETIFDHAKTLSDALRVAMPGEITFEINRRLLARGLVVTDDETLRAMGAAFTHLKIVLEPGGAVALAAALSQRVDCRNKVVVVVGSGGNVDPQTFAKALELIG